MDEAHVCRESWTATRHVIWHTDSGTLARVNAEKETLRESEAAGNGYVICEGGT